MPTYEEYERLALEGGKHANLFMDMASWCKEQAASSPLSDTERKVATLMKQGQNRTDIATVLGVSIVMISKHVAKMRSKVGKFNATDPQLIYELIKRGWLI